MMKKSKIVEKILRYYQVIQAFMVLAVILLVFSFLKIPEKIVPEIVVNQGVILGVYPGATSDEVERILTSRVEDLIFSYKLVDKVKTFSESKDGTMIIHVKLKDSTKSTQFWIEIERELANLQIE